MITNLIIRPLELRDYIQWIPLWLGYNAFYGRFGSTALDPEITRITWDRFFDESEPVHAFGCGAQWKIGRDDPFSISSQYKRAETCMLFTGSFYRSRYSRKGYRQGVD